MDRGICDEALDAQADWYREDQTRPLGQSAIGIHYSCGGRLTSLTDPKSNVTNWTYDVQGRLTGKQYPDTSTVTYAYETSWERRASGQCSPRTTGFKERVDFGETIGSVDGKPTTKGIIHHSKRGAHIVPSKP